MTNNKTPRRRTALWSGVIHRIAGKFVGVIYAGAPGRNQALLRTYDRNDYTFEELRAVTKLAAGAPELRDALRDVIENCRSTVNAPSYQLLDSIEAALILLRRIDS